MEAAMSHTARCHSGTDDRVKLPNLTDEDVNWQGLEDLYSINESLYECRPDYSPGPDNWANFQKDVDNMFALRHVLNDSKQTRKLDDSAPPELGSGTGDLEWGSGEAWSGLTTPNPSAPPPPPTLETGANDLPERPGGRGAARVLVPGDPWVRQLEEVDGEVFSGNGMTELGSRHDSLLRTHNSLLPGPAQGPGLEPEEQEDIFQAQGFLPFSTQTLKPTVQISTTRNPTPTQTTIAPQSTGVVLQATPPHSSDSEGSGFLASN